MIKPAICQMTLFLLLSCTNSHQEGKKYSQSHQAEPGIVSDTLLQADPPTQPPVHYSTYDSEANEIPPDGTYHFDVAFAEWQGQSMGERVTVEIRGDSVRVLYVGDETHTLYERGEVMDQGQLVKHKSGEWIITIEISDSELEEVGGCTGGPAIIDFKNKKYWMC